MLQWLVRGDFRQETYLDGAGDTCGRTRLGEGQGWKGDTSIYFRAYLTSSLDNGSHC